MARLAFAFVIAGQGPKAFGMPELYSRQASTCATTVSSRTHLDDDH
jgi:hypothetical protein